MGNYLQITHLFKQAGHWLTQVWLLIHKHSFIPLCPINDQHQFSPNNIKKEMFKRINHMITERKML